MARRRYSNRRRRRGGFGFLYKVLSMLVICVAIILALTLFFRVDTIVISGQQRYTDAEIQEASGVEIGDNLYLLNKPTVIRRIQEALPYIERVKRINRKLPNTLLIEVEECAIPMALVQDGNAWLISAGGKIVDRQAEAAGGDYGIITGCKLLAPSVGKPIALATEYAVQQESLLALMSALEEAEMLAAADSIRLDDVAAIWLEYDGRFSVKMPYGADYPMKLSILRQAMAQEEIREDMAGTFDMMREDNRTYFQEDIR